MNRYAEEPVVVATDAVHLRDVTETLDWGVLVEYGQWGVGVCFEGLSRSDARALLERALEGWSCDPD